MAEQPREEFPRRNSLKLFEFFTFSSMFVDFLHLEALGQCVEVISGMTKPPRARAALSSRGAWAHLDKMEIEMNGRRCLLSYSLDSD